MGFSYVESYNIPIWQRVWFIERINKELKASNEANQGNSRAAQHNDPETRAWQGRMREHVPAKLRRFT